MKKVEAENVEILEVEIKEEGKFKKWVKRHKTSLATGTTAVVGLGLSALTYKLGYTNGSRDGWNRGFNDRVDFEAGDIEIKES